MIDRLGQVFFQSNDMKDVFQVIELYERGDDTPDEELMGIIADLQFHNAYEYVTGRVPKMFPVEIEGDTVSIRAWFRGEYFDAAFYLTVYVEYEETEELLTVEHEEKIDEKNSEPAEIII